MSLDVSLISKQKILKRGSTGIFVREAGRIRELTDREAAERYPNATVNIIEDYETDEVFTANITHNLNHMADEAGLYEALWRPEDIKAAKASQLIDPIEAGIKRLISDPERYKQLNPENGWGSYDDLVEFAFSYLRACYAYPNARVEVSR